MKLETTTKVPVERLRLDRGNPRLVGEAADASDEWIIARLYRSAELDELLLEEAWARHDPRTDQVPREKLDRLRQVLVCIYGSKADDVEPVVRTRNPDIKRLGEVLVNAEGRHVLEQGRGLDTAHASTVSADTRFTALLLRARNAIRDAAGSLRAYDGQDQSLLDIADDIKETADMVYPSMAKKRRDARSSAA